MPHDRREEPHEGRGDQRARRHAEEDRRHGQALRCCEAGRVRGKLRDPESRVMGPGTRLKAALLSALLLAACLLVSHLATLPNTAPPVAIYPEYAKLLGLDKSKSDGLPTLSQLRATAWKQLSHPFYDAGSNDKGIGIQLAYSLGRVGLGFCLAALVAIPLGFVIGLSPL